ncbi:MAG TPA: TlpA disulfide reductase family protein [Candidatus Polarisedimenticolia bacterium]|nr:TlpA disulfide reductase family protein [Candidatus Polarisedimenticolia bacterium]
MPVFDGCRRRLRAGAVLLLFLSATCVPVPGLAGDASPPAPGGPAPLAAGDAAPAFEGIALDGAAVSLAGLRGRVVLLNFWGIACPPCRIEMPELEKIRRRHADLAMLGIEEMNATAAEARRFVETMGVRYPILLDPGERIGRLYRLEAHPTTVVLDRRGRISWMSAGYLRGDEREIEQAVRDALAAKDAP